VTGLKKKYAKSYRQISGAQRTNKWGVVYYFSYHFLKFVYQYFIVIQCKYFLLTTNLLTSHKNNPYFLHKVADLKKIMSQIRSQSKWGTMNKYVRSCLLLFVQFFKIN